MSNLIINNAYRTLGLTNNSSSRNILKRYKEIISRLKIDDQPRYDLDLHLPDDLRTEDSVTDALKRLQNPKSKLLEFFFWFDISDTVDENAFEYLQYGDTTSYDQAAQIWKGHSETENSTGLIYKKNLAILYYIYLFNEENDSHLHESVSIWNELVNSDKFWLSLGKKYEISDGSEVHEDVLNNLRRDVTADISDVYYDLYMHHNDTKYIREFHDVFSVLGKKVEKHLLNPTLQTVHEIIEDVNEIGSKNDSQSEYTNNTNSSCDGCGNVLETTPESHFRYKDDSILCSECHKTMGIQWQEKIDSIETVEGSSKMLRRIEKDIEQLKLNIEWLQEIGLYDADPVKIMRDHTAKAINRASVEIHNQTHMREESLKLIELAKEISTTAGTKEKLEADSKKVKEIITMDEESTLTIEIGRIRKKKLVVKGTFMEYEKSKIYYDDVRELLYYYNGKHVFEIASSRDRIFLKLNESSWVTLINKAVPLIEPHVVRYLVKLIFENEEEVHMGSIRFDKTGYHRDMKSVLWNEEIHAPHLVNGMCILYANYDGSVGYLDAISLRVTNAVIIPELVKACHNEFHMRNPKKEPLAALYEQIMDCVKKNTPKKQTQADEKPEILDDGIGFHNGGMYDKAIEFFEKILKSNPGNYAALVCKGLSFAHAGHKTESMDCFDKIPESETLYHVVLNGRGAALHVLGQMEEAATCYDKAIKIKPDYARTYYNKGLLCYDLGEFHSAVDFFEKAYNTNHKHALAIIWKSYAQIMAELSSTTQQSQEADLSIICPFCNALTSLTYLFRYEVDKKNPMDLEGSTHTGSTSDLEMTHELYSKLGDRHKHSERIFFVETAKVGEHGGDCHASGKICKVFNYVYFNHNDKTAGLTFHIFDIIPTLSSTPMSSTPSSLVQMAMQEYQITTYVDM